MFQVTQELIIDNRNGAGLAALAVHLDTFALEVDVADIQPRGFFASQARPIERLQKAAVAKGGRYVEELFDFSQIEMIGRGLKLEFSQIRLFTLL